MYAVGEIWHRLVFVLGSQRAKPRALFFWNGKDGAVAHGRQSQNTAAAKEREEEDKPINCHFCFRARAPQAIAPFALT